MGSELIVSGLSNLLPAATGNATAALTNAAVPALSNLVSTNLSAAAAPSVAKYYLDSQNMGTVDLLGKPSVGDSVDLSNLTGIEYIPRTSRIPQGVDQKTGIGHVDLAKTGTQSLLSPAQEAFFKDSQVRDSSGNLLPVYHGTNSEFTVFDNSRTGQSNTIAPVGFWFTPNEKGAQSFANDVWYGDNKPTVMKTYLNMKNPKVYAVADNSAQIAPLEQELRELSSKRITEYEKAISEGRIKDLMKDSGSEYAKTVSRIRELENAIDDLSYQDPYEQFRSDIYAVEGKSPREANIGGVGYGLENSLETVPKYVESLKNQGHDGIIIRGTNYDAGTLGKNNDQYVVFDSNQIKNVDNLNPTDNPDIRYYLDGGGGYGGFSNSVERVGSADVAKIDENTLPQGWDKLKKYLDTADKRVENAIGKPKSKITKQDLIKYNEDYGYDTEGTKYELWNGVKSAIDDEILDDLYMEGASSAADILATRRRDDFAPIENVYMGAKGRTGRLDAELSDRLGIGRSNTPMLDTTNKWNTSAQGDYGGGVIGSDPLWSTGETGVSNVAHERLHSIQEHARLQDYDPAVSKAFNELEDELIPLLHDKEQIVKKYGSGNANYWLERNEQESRMFQDYLEYKNYTQRRIGGKRDYEYGEEIIKPFDKFIEKLRKLSKKGIALPSLALLFGGAALSNKEENEQ